MKPICTNKIILVDSGIDLNNKSFKVLGGKNFIHNQASDNLQDYNGHGTYCASIITSINPDVEFYIVKILDNKAEASSELLMQALEYIQEIDVRTVCLSLAMYDSNYLNELMELCKKLYLKGSIVVSSVMNGGITSYPASFPHVIGVNSVLMESDSMFWFNKENEIQCIGDVTPQMVPKLDGTYKMFGGNSKANAYIAGKIANILSKEPELSFSDILSLLENQAFKKNWTADDIADGKIEIKEVEPNHNRLGSVSAIQLEVHKIISELLPFYKSQQVLLSKLALTNFLHPMDYYNIIKRINQIWNCNIPFTKVSYRNFASIFALSEFISSQLDLEQSQVV